MQRDPVTTYMRIIEDLQRIAATAPQPPDPELVWEIKELKEVIAYA
jgi:hypothetical protein